MLFTERELNVFNPLDILNEATYLTEDESATEIITVPVVQNDYYNCNMIDFRDIDRISEEYGCDYIDAMSAIIESEQLNPDYTSVVIDEADFILESIDGTVFHEDTIIRPLSENDSEYQLVLECVESFLESGNEIFLDVLSEEMTTQLARELELAGAPPNMIKNLYDKPTDVIEKRIKQLREKQNSRGARQAAASSLKKLRSRWSSAVKDKETAQQDAKSMQKSRDTLYSRWLDEKKQHGITQSRVENLEKQLGSTNSELIRTRGQVTDERLAGQKALEIAGREGMAQMQRADKAEQQLGQTQQQLGQTKQQLGAVGAQHDRLAKEYGEYKNKGLHRAADKLYAAGNWMKNNKGKTALGVAAGAAAVGAGIYAYQQYKNKPKSVIAKRIAALRGIYRKFMVNAQRNPQKAGIFKRIAAKILSVIDKLMGFLQNATDSR